MNDRCFINVTNENNLIKVNIDSRLIESFKRVMLKLQYYLNEHDLSLEVNYEEYLNKYLLSESKEKLSIIVDELDYSIGGDYSSNEKRIRINEDVLNNHIEELDHVLCHEFIHFLIHHHSDILYGSNFMGQLFIDEAFTELLAREVIPSKNIYYGALPNIMNFYNKLVGNNINYSYLFSHKLQDLMRSGYFPKTFIIHGDNCMQKYKDGEYKDDNYQYDSEYLGMQRDIINQFCNFEITNFTDLKVFLEILGNRPALDEEWVTNFIFEHIKPYMDSLPEEKYNYLFEYISLYNSLLKYNQRDVCEIVLGEHLLLFDGNNIEGLNNDITYSFVISGNKSLLQLKDKKGNSINFDYQNADIFERKKTIKQRIEELNKTFLSKSL